MGTLMMILAQIEGASEFKNAVGKVVSVSGGGFDGDILGVIMFVVVVGGIVLLTKKKPSNNDKGLGTAFMIMLACIAVWGMFGYKA